MTRILLVEDNPGDARLLREALSEAGAAGIDLTCVEGLTEALRRLREGGFALALLDLSLPESAGLDTLARMRREAPETPVVVLTGLDDGTMAVQAVQQGAQDYLVKGQVDGNMLVRSIRYAIERHRLQRELEQTRQQEEQEQERRSLERLSGPPPAPVTSQAFGLASLRESAPEVFSGLAGRYGDLLDLALEQRAYRVEHPVSERLRALAEDLGVLKAGPRDVVDIHRTALEEKCRKAGPEKARVYIEEGRLTVLELMGHLTSCYRNYSLDRTRVRVSARAGADNQGGGA